MKANPEEVAKIIQYLPKRVNPGNYEGFQPTEESAEVERTPVIVKAHQVAVVDTSASKKP